MRISASMEGISRISKGTYIVKLLSPDGSTQEGTFHLEDLGGSCKLTLHFGGRQLSATSSDFFDALVQIRRRLEKENLLPACYGASRNVYPSDMSLAVAHGLMAPRWQSGRRLPDDLVFIFHCGPDVDPVGVAAQREFHQRCVAALEPVMRLDDEPVTPKLAA